jgi:MFS family permease
MTRCWTLLILAALANMAAYYSYDAIAPIAGMLHADGMSESRIGLLNAVYSLPNIPLSLVGGVLIDRIGAGRAGLLAATLCLAGAAMTAIGAPYALMVGGRLVFGIGSETLYIALLCAIAGWFAGGHGALPTALFFSLARVGSYLADTSPHWAGAVYARGWHAPLWLAAGLCAGGFVAALAMDRLDPGGATAGERVDWRRLGGFSRAFWHILWLNVLFASVFFPFRSTFSIAYFQDARGLTLAQAGIANSWVFFAAIPATPLFGWIADRFDHRAGLLMIGAALMPVTFVLLGTEASPLWVTTALMGISFSVIPAVIWPATALLVPRARLGSAFGLINMLQSLGLALSNLCAGWLNDVFAAGPRNPAGYLAMFVWFTALALLALGAAIGLWRSQRLGKAHEEPAPRTE